MSKFLTHPDSEHALPLRTPTNIRHYIQNLKVMDNQRKLTQLSRTLECWWTKAIERQHNCIRMNKAHFLIWVKWTCGCVGRVNMDTHSCTIMTNVAAQNGIHRMFGTQIIQKALLHTTFGACTAVEIDPLTTAVVIDTSQSHNVTSCTVKQSMSVFIVKMFFLCVYEFI